MEPRFHNKAGVANRPRQHPQAIRGWETRHTGQVSHDYTDRKHSPWPAAIGGLLVWVVLIVALMGLLAMGRG